MSHYRHEYKYRIDACQEAILRIWAQGLLLPDPHVGKDGTYLVRSLYLDDLFDSCLEENLAGTDPRSKFRIRYYNDDPTRLTLEKKSKVRGMTRKESCPITASECEALLEGKSLQPDPNDPVRCALLTELQIRDLRPKCIVTYERIPFIYPGGNVRVTFDRGIATSSDLEHFLNGDYVQRPILPPGETVLEVKWDEVLPRHIREGLNLEGLTWTAFSKYFFCRMIHL